MENGRKHKFCDKERGPKLVFRTLLGVVNHVSLCSMQIWIFLFKILWFWANFSLKLWILHPINTLKPFPTSLNRFGHFNRRSPTKINFSETIWVEQKKKTKSCENCNRMENFGWFSEIKMCVFMMETFFVQKKIKFIAGSWKNMKLDL